ncbi:MAG: zinc ribbon domain-containing protein [Acidobacteria bacterium]|nr:zinc ribbon domain-containing protein [Acidobacteriota bacterium]
MVFACVLLAVGVIGFVLVVRDQDIPPAPVENPELTHLQERRVVLFENLKDLQFEYLQGKLSDGDYQSLKLGFQNDLAVVLASIDMLQEKFPQAVGNADASAAAGKSIPPSTVNVSGRCPACHAENPDGHRFCGNCGGPLG